MTKGLVDACVRHPIMSILQGVVIAALIWVGSTLLTLNEKVATLSVEVAVIKSEIGRLRSREDNRPVSERDYGKPR